MAGAVAPVFTTETMLESELDAASPPLLASEPRFATSFPNAETWGFNV